MCLVRVLYCCPMATFVFDRGYVPESPLRPVILGLQLLNLLVLNRLAEFHSEVLFRILCDARFLMFVLAIAPGICICGYDYQYSILFCVHLLGVSPSVCSWSFSPLRTRAASSSRSPSHWRNGSWRARTTRFIQICARLSSCGTNHEVVFSSMFFFATCTPDKAICTGR